MRKPSVLILIARVAVISALAALLTFAVFLLFGIIGVVVADLIRGGGVNLTFAYRRVAFPAAVVAFVIAMATALRGEVRHYRDALASSRAHGKLSN